MHRDSKRAPLPGKGAGDPHKKTARSGKAHDKARRRAKRLERRELKQTA